MTRIMLVIALVAVVATVLLSALGGAFTKSAQKPKPPHWYKPQASQVAVSPRPPHWFKPSA